MRAILANILIILLLCFLFWVAFKSLAFLGKRTVTASEQAMVDSNSDDATMTMDEDTLSAGETVIQAIKGSTKSDEVSDPSGASLESDGAEVYVDEEEDLEPEEKPYVEEELESAQESVKTLTEEEQAAAKALAAAPAEKVKSEEVPESYESESEEAEAPKPSPAPASSTSSNPFLVIAGSFSVAQNAQTELKRFQKMGYANAEVVQFEGRAFHSLCLGRFANKSEAGKIVAQLKKKGLESYVHRLKQ